MEKLFAKENDQRQIKFKLTEWFSPNKEETKLNICMM